MQSRDTRTQADDIARVESLIGKTTPADPTLNTEAKSPSRIELAKTVLTDKPNGFLKALESKGPLKNTSLGMI